MSNNKCPIRKNPYWLEALNVCLIMSNNNDIELDLWIGIVVASPTCHPARRSCYGFDTRTHAAAGGLQWGDKSVCTTWTLMCTQL